MSHLDLKDGEWSAVQVGPETLGWVGPYMSIDCALSLADITILMGDNILPLDATVFSLGLLDPFSQNHFRGSVKSLLNYCKRFAVHVPAGSLDISDEGEINYSGRSLETLRLVLSKFFAACADEIQANLHTLATPAEVVRKYAELMHYGYPTALCEALTWRGRLLSDIPQGTQVQVQTVRFGAFSTYPYSGHWNLGQVQRSDVFTSLVEWQTRISFDESRVIPENVFLVETTSDKEHELGKRLFQTPDLLRRYLTKIRPEVKDASFFLCQTGDPLEEWIDGEVISMKDFSKFAFKVKAEIQKAMKDFDEGLAGAWGWVDA